MAKSPDAFRTISEVSAWLETPPHVLRFWESKFPQVKPVKRAGGRRYYRPEDIALLGGIKVLLHEQGMTIRGVQKMLREQGVRHVASLSAQVWTEDGSGEADLDGDLDRDLDPDLDVALGSDFDGDLDVDDADEETDDAINGVIVGPWTGREDLREVTAAQEDLAHLAALDGIQAESASEDLESKGGESRREGAVGDAAPGRDAQEQVEPTTLIDAFLAGTLNRLAADRSEDRQGAEDVAGPEPEGVAPRRAPGPALPPLPPGEPTLDRALALLRRADPDRLRARADRIAPLLDRLKALREGLPRWPA